MSNCVQQAQSYFSPEVPLRNQVDSPAIALLPMAKASVSQAHVHGHPILESAVAKEPGRSG
jgi:hypothetical protein